MNTKSEGLDPRAERRPRPQIRMGRDAADSFAPGQNTCATRGFTLLELLVVIAIVGLIAGLAMPTIGKFKPNYTASATSQLISDISRARQLAISQHTTVYMVFVPPSFFTDNAYTYVNNNPWFTASPSRSTNLFEKQMIGYNFVSLRSMGDQPGRSSVRYLSSWKTLPAGAFIPMQKFVTDPSMPPALTIYTNNAASSPVLAFQVYGFNKTIQVPFPTEDAPRYKPAQPYIRLPYLAFDYQGRLVTGRDEIIPLAKGTVNFSHDKVTKQPIAAPPSLNEQPPGSVTNTYNLVYIDWLTGRARAIQQEAQ